MISGSSRRRALLGILGGLATAIVAWVAISQVFSGPGVRGHTKVARSAPASPRRHAPGKSPRRPAFPQLRSLSPRQLAGQRIIYSYQGLTPPAGLLSQIRAGEAAGVIFFSDNISSQTQIREVISQLQRAARQSPIKKPLLMMTDQEGGAVTRLPGAPEASEKQIGTSPDAKSAARDAGRGPGLNLRNAGMNVNLAPVLDVYRTPGNFIDQYGRSYSDQPGTVSRLGTAFITAQQSIGVAATGKHFPGLGAASQPQDTDAGPVTLVLSRQQLRATDERPYGPAIAAGLKLVMVSWAVYPALDPDHPAGLSRTVVQGELRQRLHFTGVTITDALEAGALRAYGGISQTSVLAARAGMDLLLCSEQTVDQGDEAVSALAMALGEHRLSSSEFLASVKRIIGLRASLAGSDARPPG